jgi:Ca2+-transporting ATPase
MARSRGVAVRRPVARAVVAAISVAGGRARLRVDGLRGRGALATRLTERLAADGAVRHVRASPVTGTVLVLYDARRRRLGRLIADVERYAREGVRGAPERRRPNTAWHALTPAEVSERLATPVSTGLTRREAEARRAVAGANRLPDPEPKSALTILGGHLASLPVLLLGGAAALSVATGALVDAAVILAVVGANAAVGYVTERKVDRILTTLQRAVVPQAFVRRDGEERLLAASAIVPGDVLVLKTGHEVSADARLVEVLGLAVDESALTGESAPVPKIASVVCAGEAPLADRANMVFAGTVVAEGSALGIVTGTGRDTEFGKIHTLIAETSAPPTSLERHLDRMGRQLVGVSLAFCGLALGLGLLRGIGALEMLRSAISLAVAAVPEGLPAVATTTLALGVQRMMGHRTLVRRLSAIENLGATTVICADKTGTLTENRMRVHAWYLGGREYQRLDGAGRQSDAIWPVRAGDRLLARAAAVAVLCNEAELGEDAGEVRGSSTELALLRGALDAGVDGRRLRRRYRLVQLRRRLEGDNWMAAVHSTRDGLRLVTMKGAPEEVLERATRWLDGDAERPLTTTVKQEILRTNAKIAAQGFRVLGLAFGAVAAGEEPLFAELTWVGLVALSDPVRPGVREAIAACREAGIRTLILTGDQAATAAAIGRELGLARNGEIKVLEASRLAGVDPAALRDLVRDVDVFARVSPAHKYHIVRALQASGEVVAMTGDGINDAAALRAADIGVAMGGRGTDVAREVADVVLVDDDFASIVRAIEQGRTIHANIGKSLTFLLSTNFSEILLTLGALGFGVARPLSAIQFLWINLLSDVFPALALAVEPPEVDVMKRPPRDPAQSILSRRELTTIAADGAILAATALGAHGLAAARYGVGPRATTVAFSTLMGAQLLHALRCRSANRSGLSRLRESPLLVGTIGASLAVQGAAIAAPPLRRLLGTTPLSLADVALVAGGAALPLLAREARRATTVAVTR